MTTIPDLQRYIRFQLSELRIRNEHHRFEDLTRHFSRLRICERILPATGPVGSGGDQGRDFETFKSYLQSTPIASSTFLSVDTEKQIVFACSLQQENIAQKIRSDVKTICGSGTKPSMIYYFCESNVPISARHDLQTWCLSDYNVELEVIDGQGLSESLTDVDVFWIAQEFLGVPADMFPRPADRSEWYEALRSRWFNGDREPVNFADFVEIKRALRRATFKKAEKPDLREWIRLMRKYLDGRRTLDLERAATYEICVAALRGLNNLTAESPLLHRYFSDIKVIERPIEIEDALTLLSYCSSAYLQGHLEIDVGQLHEWSRDLFDRINAIIAGETSSSARCQLQVSLGRSGFLPFRDGVEPTYNLDETFDHWEKLFDIVDNAPLFPIESFSDLLVAMTRFVGDDPRFIDLTRRVDELLTIRTGGFTAAEKCRDRAVAYYEANKILLAIQQLHESRVRWFTAETLEGSVLSMLFLSHCYRSLGLIQAAKYYAAGALYAAHEYDEPAIKKKVVQAASEYCASCYAGGEWLNFLSTAWLAIAAQNAYESDPQEIQEHESMATLLYHGSIARVLAKRALPSVSAYVESLIATWPLDELNQSEFSSLCADESTFLYTEPVENLIQRIRREIGYAPFCELGRRRQIVWRALGIDWEVCADGDYKSVLAAEEFAAALQIVIADLASCDLCLLPMRVRINFELSSSCENAEVTPLPDNEVCSYTIVYPEWWVGDSNAWEDATAWVCTSAVLVLQGCTMLRGEEFLATLESAFEKGLASKAFSVRPYAALISEILPNEQFDEDLRGSTEPLHGTQGPSKEFHSDLKWRDGPGPGYTREKAHEYIRNRYRKAIKPIKLSLPKWRNDKRFQKLVENLRSEGYRDWHILLLLHNFAINYRIHLLAGGRADMATSQRLAAQLVGRDETWDDIPIEVEAITEEAIEIVKMTTIMSIAKTWGLENAMQTPNFVAVKRLLDARYGNSVDDVEHEDILGQGERFDAPPGC